LASCRNKQVEQLGRLAIQKRFGEDALPDNIEPSGVQLGPRSWDVRCVYHGDVFEARAEAMDRHPAEIIVRKDRL
jgi:hypothetical protein